MPKRGEKVFNPVRDIEEFHGKFKLVYEGKPRALPYDLQTFRDLFLREELEEYSRHVSYLANTLGAVPVAAIDPADITFHLEEMLDGLVDLVYVTLGTSYLHGFDFEEAWKRVHAANMMKVRALVPEDSKRDFTHDVVKPVDWVAPSHSDLVEDHAHQIP